MDFFKQREKYHLETANWYFNHLSDLEEKANSHIHKAETAYSNYSHYLELICRAYSDYISHKEEMGVK
jgi:hypothetical protein